ncbi:Major facilitator superfamily domain, general substrate transporter [Penicillium expansum]|uniref:Major facilitator superfamily domain, general substrate transporter n=1 Tax=Penicillium expansum TaxID=27334 RepID=A0A0A2J775_PENEN|nr:Major facilitator superfamily domain, general substrate transporter [Penicillium expansum]KGO48205.1 Major facilitator superfamily domain, general substrate transporter [Penicillium expansum]KGO61316.1 Major facilitator superfamily domain, general substrate transporter [Penicillium expansum]
MYNTGGAENGYSAHNRRMYDHPPLEPAHQKSPADDLVDKEKARTFECYPSCALTGNFASIISVDQNIINLGNQLMFLGVIVLEIPSNIILHKIGPRQWISAQVCVFGIVACLQVLVRNKLGFLLTRTFLGLAEAGYIPGAMYTLSTWYTKQELTKRIAIFFFGMFGGTAVSPLLGAALLKLDGKMGLFGWQWIFLVEGLFSIVVSIILFFFLPEHKEVSVLPNQVHLSQPGGLGPMHKPLPHPGKTHISFNLVWKTLTNVRKWPHFIATGCVFATWSPLTTYTPSIFVELGFSRIKANALCAIGSLLTLPVILFFAWISDKSNKRGLAVMVAIFVYLIALVILRIMVHRVDNWGKFGLWTAVNALAVGYHPIHNSWIQINCKSSEERNISVA